jgi:hypothetical protein
MDAAMMKYKQLVVVVAVLAAGVGWILWPRPSPVTRENWDRVVPGMTRQDVLSLLGEPGDFSTGPTRRSEDRVAAWHDPSTTTGGPQTVEIVYWHTDDLTITAWFYSDGRLAVKTLCRKTREEQGPLEGFLWRIKRQWREWFPERPARESPVPPDPGLHR